MKKISPQKFRKYNKSQTALLNKFVTYKPEKMHKVIDRFVHTKENTIPIRIYQPLEAENLPILMFFHGGGFVIGDIETHDNICRRLAKLVNCIVIAVNYRLAPEHKFPAAIHDCYNATLWASQNASSLGGDAQRIAVCGDSAGGNLATVVAMMARDKSEPKIVFQALIYPCVDGTFSQPSIEELSDGYILTKEMMLWFWQLYKNKDEDVLNPYFSPLLGDNLRHLPPALIITAEFDPLKDEGRLYAEKLKEAGVWVKHKEFDGMIHIFFQMPKLLKKARQAQELVVSELKTAFGTQGLI